MNFEILNVLKRAFSVGYNSQHIIFQTEKVKRSLSKTGSCNKLTFVAFILKLNMHQYVRGIYF